jgi:hypothetical protein
MRSKFLQLCRRISGTYQWGIAGLYYLFCWFTGQPDADGDMWTIEDRNFYTYMMRLQKERLGLVWWFLSLGTIQAVSISVYHTAQLGRWGYFSIHLAILAFCYWLFVHVLLIYKLPPGGAGN